MKKITLFTLVTLLLCTSCVTKKKFLLAEMAATASKDSLQELLNNSREVGNQLSAQVKTSCVIRPKWGTVSASIRVC